MPCLETLFISQDYTSIDFDQIKFKNMSLLDDWNNEINSAGAGLQLMRLADDSVEPPLFSLDHRAEFLSQ
jgi:hypothetical protein